MEIKHAKVTADYLNKSIILHAWSLRDDFSAISLYYNIHEVFDQFGITHAVMDIALTYTNSIPEHTIVELADFLKIIHMPNADPDMVVEDEDDLIKVTIARITQFAKIESGYSETEKYTPLMAPHPIGPGISRAVYGALGSEIMDRHYQEIVQDTVCPMTAQLCCLRSWWNQLNLVSLLE